MVTLRGYINNPSGTSASVISNRKMYEDMYREKYGKIMTRENGHMDYKLYMKKGIYVAHVKVPSETIEKFYYDVVFAFDAGKDFTKLDTCETWFFSNDPHFNYTFAYAFKKHKMTIKELEPNMSKIALREPPKDKNPDSTIGYVKTIFFAYIFLSEKGLLYKRRFENEAGKLDWKMLTKLVAKTDEKIEDREKAGAKLASSNKKNKDKDPIVPFGKADIKHPEFHQQSAFLGKVGRVQTIGMNNITSTKKTRTTKKTKKI